MHPTSVLLSHMDGDVSSRGDRSQDVKGLRETIRKFKVVDKSQSDSFQCAQGPKHTQRLSLWWHLWRTPASILGFYTAGMARTKTTVFELTLNFLALLCAVIHFCVFNYLDGRIADRRDRRNEEIPFRSTSIPQSYVTTISLVLVTAFRAALVASI